MARDDQPSGREIDGMLQRLEQRIDTLKKRYERYFLGIERRPPMAMRKQVVREVFEAENTYIGNTAQKFKLRSLVQNFNTNKARWNRIMRQIEKGTYHRDRKRAKRREEKRQERQQEEPEDDVLEIDPDKDFIEDLDDMDLDEVFDQPGDQPRKQPSQPTASTDSGPQPSAAQKEKIKQQRLAEIQAKLGISNDEQSSSTPAAQPNKQASPPQTNEESASPASSPKDSRRQKLEAMRQKLKRKKSRSSSKSRSRSTDHNSDGATKSKPQSTSGRKSKLQKLKQKLDREKGQKKRSRQRSNASRPTTGGKRRVVDRSGAKTNSDDDARRVYNNLIEAKRRCNEPTDNLSYDAVKKSMDRQRNNLRKNSGARDVDFDVVIKDGQAFLKPDPKD